MKQVIVKIKDCKATNTKTIATAYYHSLNQYESEIFDFVKSLMPGQEIDIKVGNQYRKFVSYEDLLNNMQEYDTDFDTLLYNEVADDSFLLNYIKNYLPRY